MVTTVAASNLTIIPIITYTPFRLDDLRVALVGTHLVIIAAEANPKQTLDLQGALIQAVLTGM